MGKCRKCGHQSEYTKSIYCFSCWEKLQKENSVRFGVKRCQICKTKITSNWKYCSDCKKRYGK